jgi:carbon starvation protein CstA
MAKKELGRLSWITVTLAAFFMATVAISGMGMGFISALEHNSWATFVVMMTIPVSLFMYANMSWIRKSKVLET